MWVVIKQGVCTSTVHDCLCFILLLRHIVFRQGGHVCGCLCFMLALLLSRCVVFRQLTSQDVSSLGRGVMSKFAYMYLLWCGIQGSL